MAKKGGGSNDGSRVMFVSLFMILLAFFILLNSLATIQEERKKEALKSLGGAFGQLPRGASLNQAKRGSPSSPAEPLESKQAASQLLAQIRNLFTGKMGKGVEVSPAPGGRGVLIRIEAPTTFGGNATALPAQLKERLQKLAGLAKEAGTGVVVRGHTSLQLDKSLEEAWWISGRRAQNVVRVFHQAGVPVSDVKMSGVGDLRPVGSEATAASRRRNERVEVLLKLEEESKLDPLFQGGDHAPPIRTSGGAGNGQE
jgi:chemotaxis protein MotB